MLANKSFVRSIVNSIADMQGNSLYRRQWCDKTSVSDEERLLTFRFWNCTEADTVARGLQTALTAQGYTNKVKRTTVNSDMWARTEGGEYVRVRVFNSN
jgi:hypothetical protein